MKMFDLTEFHKLRGMLEKAQIPHVVEVRIEPKDQQEARTKFTTAVDDYPMNSYQIVYRSVNNYRSDVVIGYGTYGHEQGLLEQMGLLPDADQEVEGWLDAETVFKRWSDDWNSKK